MAHLAFTKWRDSAFSTEQLRTTRWLLGAKPKQMPDALVEILTVGPVAQAMLMDLHIKSFVEATRRLKVSAGCRKRASAEEFDKLVDFACVFASLRLEAKKVNSDPSVDSKLVEAFLAKRLDRILNKGDTWVQKTILSSVWFALPSNRSIINHIRSSISTAQGLLAGH